MPTEFDFAAGTEVAKFIASNKQVDYIQGPLGSGKTVALLLRAMRHAQEQKPSPIDGIRYSRWGIVRNTLPDLKRSTVKTWLELFPEHIYGRFNAAPGFMQHLIKYNDIVAEFHFMSLDKIEDVRKLRSTEFTGILFNELPFMPKELFDEAHSRLRYPPERHGGPTWCGILADGNAPDEDCWLAMMTGQVDLPPGLLPDEISQYHWPASWGFYKQPPAVLEEFDNDGALTGYKVNPATENLRNLRAGYYQQQLFGKSRAWIESRLMNRVALVVEGQPVWPMFRREFHVAKDPLRPIENNDVIVAMDFGRVFPAALFAQEVNQRIFVQYEMLGFNEPASVFAPKVQRFLTQHYPGFDVRFVGDPKGADKGQATEQSSYDIFRAHGMPVAPAPIKQNDIAARTEAVAYVLNDNPRGHNRLVISPLCRTLIVGMAGRYHLVREEDGELRPKKDKYSNLCFAAGTLVSTPNGPTPIEQLKVGHFVSTPFGPRAVLATGHRKADIVRLRLSNRATIDCTPDHPFWTYNGWVKAEDLSWHRLMMEGEAGWPLPLKSGHALEISPSSSWVSATIAAANIFTGHSQMGNYYIAPSGSITMDQYRPSTTFITRTAIELITISTILNACANRLIAACTCGIPNVWQRRGETLKRRLLPRLLNATLIQNGQQTSAGPPVEQPLGQSLKCPSNPINALGAAKPTKLGEYTASAASALCHVRAWLAKLLASITKNETASNAAPPSPQTNTPKASAVHIVARECVPPALVYNITVEGAHCYYANGALVSNCDALQYLCLGLGEGRRMIGLRPIGQVAPARIRQGHKTMRRISA